jgi:hypothetical protein
MATFFMGGVMKFSTISECIHTITAERIPLTRPENMRNSGGKNHTFKNIFLFLI